MRPLALLLVIAVAGLAGAEIAAAAPAAGAASDTQAGVAAEHKAKHKRNRRRGGKVRAAWPRAKHGRPPRRALARWLARQVGPVEVKRRRAQRAGAAGPLATRAQAGSGSGTSTGLSGAGSGPLWLVRSFDIPRSDPAHHRLANYSWTYDNALATLAFVSVGARSAAEQILDQLKALQRKDGSIEFAFDTSTGAAAPYYRAGALAWVGLAATAYRRTYDSSRYDAMIAGLAHYLLDLRDAGGLVRGGPDVSWVSTQHNLLTVGFLSDLADQLATKEKIGGYTKPVLESAQTLLGNTVLSKLLVSDSATVAHFKQGIDDGQVPLDVQALGAMYLELRGDARATRVASAVQSWFTVPARRTAGDGPYSGYRPFSAAGTPDTIWSEGTIEASLALGRLGISSPFADAAVASIASSAAGSATGPIGADRDVVSPVWGEYHTWPTSAAASWLLIRVSPTPLLFAH